MTEQRRRFATRLPPTPSNGPSQSEQNWMDTDWAWGREKGIWQLYLFWGRAANLFTWNATGKVAKYAAASVTRHQNENRKRTHCNMLRILLHVENTMFILVFSRK
jgi:hypothetical protein